MTAARDRDAQWLLRLAILESVECALRMVRMVRKIDYTYIQTSLRDSTTA
jgi:hypothetical protein